jgi:hypothetical protein
MFCYVLRFSDDFLTVGLKTSVLLRMREKLVILGLSGRFNPCSDLRMEFLAGRSLVVVESVQDQLKE